MKLNNWPVIAVYVATMVISGNLFKNYFEFSSQTLLNNTIVNSPSLCAKLKNNDNPKKIQNDLANQKYYKLRIGSIFFSTLMPVLPLLLVTKFNKRNENFQQQGQNYNDVLSLVTTASLGTATALTSPGSTTTANSITNQQQQTNDILKSFQQFSNTYLKQNVPAVQQKQVQHGQLAQEQQQQIILSFASIFITTVLGILGPVLMAPQRQIGFVSHVLGQSSAYGTTELSRFVNFINLETNTTDVDAIELAKVINAISVLNVEGYCNVTSEKCEMVAKNKTMQISEICNLNDDSDYLFNSLFFSSFNEICVMLGACFVAFAINFYILSKETKIWFMAKIFVLFLFLTLLVYLLNKQRKKYEMTLTHIFYSFCFGCILQACIYFFVKKTTVVKQ